MVNVVANTQRRIESRQRRPLIDILKRAGKLLVKLCITGIDRTKERFLTLVVCWRPSVNGIQIVEPEYIGSQHLSRSRIFRAPLTHRVSCIHPQPRALLDLLCIAAQSRSVRWYPAKNRYNQHVLARETLQRDAPATRERGIV